MNNYSKLDLFRRELNAQGATLREILSTLPTAPITPAQIDQATECLQSLCGSAQIVDLEVAASLVQSIKDCFLACHDRADCLNPDTIDLLTHAIDLIFSMSEAADIDLEQWIAASAWDIKTTQKAIAAIAGVAPTQSESFSTASKTISEAAPAIKHPVAAVVAASMPSSMSVAVAAPIEVSIESPIAQPSESPITTPIAAPVISSPATHDAPLVMTAEDSSMMELFRLELEAQANILNDSLLELESNTQSRPVLESLMRAAHSIKGSARIVSLDAVVHLAHVMEDCFVAAQSKTIVLNSSQIDTLLQGVDLLQAIHQISLAELSSWLPQQKSSFAQVQAQVTAILNPDTVIPISDPVQPSVVAASSEMTAPSIVPAAVPTSTPATEAASPVTATPVTATPVTATPVVIKETPTAEAEPIASQDRVVRVSAENLNRIMGLAGESLIEANWLQPHADLMMSLKWRLVELSRQLEGLQNSLDRGSIAPESRSILELVRKNEQECLDFLSVRLNELELYAQRTANLSDRLYREVISSHMRPFADGTQGFPRMIRDLARKLNKQVRLEISGRGTPVDRDILKKLEAPLTHILRNAVDHGIELPEERITAGKSAEGTLTLEAFHRGGMLAITVSDNGKGINPDWLRQKIISKKLSTPEMVAQMKDAELLEFIFLPGFSTAQQVTEISGRGVGLDIAKSMAQEVGGNVRVSSEVGKGTSFHFQLPLTLSVVRTLLVEVSGNPYAIPLARIEHILPVSRSQIAAIENRQYFVMNDQNIGLIPAYQVLELPPSEDQQEELPVVVISDQSNSYGLVVDRFLGEHDLVVRPLDPRLGKVPDISASSLLSDGTPVLIIDVTDMVQSIDEILRNSQDTKVQVLPVTNSQAKTKRILVVDDSITVREMERKMLENRGYQVDIAVNGAEGWSAVRTNAYDLVISDVDMPKMNGIELVRQIKSHDRLSSTPVIIISYRDREEDRIQGLEAGADYYLTKSSFHDESFIGAVSDLLG
jgi:two-component system, chemotaxis family, sensor histidine kinase and response regulator WspE